MIQKHKAKLADGSFRAFQIESPDTLDELLEGAGEKREQVAKRVYALALSNFQFRSAASAVRAECPKSKLDKDGKAPADWKPTTYFNFLDHLMSDEVRDGEPSKEDVKTADTWRASIQAKWVEPAKAKAGDAWDEDMALAVRQKCYDSFTEKLAAAKPGFEADLWDDEGTPVALSALDGVARAFRLFKAHKAEDLI